MICKAQIPHFISGSLIATVLIPRTIHPHACYFLIMATGFSNDLGIAFGRLGIGLGGTAFLTL
jgi:hypothetical protein